MSPLDMKCEDACVRVCVTCKAKRTLTRDQLCPAQPHQITYARVTILSSVVRQVLAYSRHFRSSLGQLPCRTTYRRVKNIRISAHFTHLRKFINFVFATEVTMIFSGFNPLMCLRECALISNPWKRASTLVTGSLCHTEKLVKFMLYPSRILEIGIARRASFGAAFHVEKFRKCQFVDVGESVVENVFVFCIHFYVFLTATNFRD